MTFKMFIVVDALLFMLLMLFYGNSADVHKQQQQPEPVKIAVVDTTKENAITIFSHGLLGQELELDTHTKSK